MLRLGQSPLGEAILRSAKKRNLELYEGEAFETITGRGVKAKIYLSSPKLVLVGNRKLMNEQKVDYQLLEGVLAPRARAGSQDYHVYCDRGESRARASNANLLRKA